MVIPTDNHFMSLVRVAVTLALLGTSLARAAAPPGLADLSESTPLTLTGISLVAIGLHRRRR